MEAVKRAKPNETAVIESAESILKLTAKHVGDVALDRPTKDAADLIGQLDGLEAAGRMEAPEDNGSKRGAPLGLASNPGWMPETIASNSLSRRISAAGDAALERQRGSEGLLKQAAHLARSRMDLDKALAMATRAVDMFPHADAYNQRASIHMMRGGYPDALADVDRSLKDDPGGQYAMSLRAYLLAKSGKPLDAVAAADEALARDPRDAYAYLARAIAEGMLGRVRQMERDLKAAVKINPPLYGEYEKAARAHGLPVQPLEMITNADAFGTGRARHAATRSDSVAWFSAGAGAFVMLALALTAAWRRWGLDALSELAAAGAMTRRLAWAGAAAAAILVVGAVVFQRRWSASGADITKWWRAPTSHRSTSLASF
ncbi:MAG: hypothetical protein HY078_15255 [Elusimicrobia bacterium]|nr:hypothetical protein [Elusimicrobiota bacterium]